MSTSQLDELEQRLGLVFTDKDLLRLALFHSSYVNEQNNITASNERLEFLGDAVLSLVVADYLYRTYPEHTEGMLTELRGALVRRETLNSWANRFELGQYLYLGSGAASTGGRTQPAILAATFEAVLGALYLERGLEGVANWLLPIVKTELEVILAEGRHFNYKSRFQIEAQRRYHQVPVYELIGTTGPSHEPVFEVEAHLGERVLGRGSGKTKQDAQQAAARAALDILEAEAQQEAQPTEEAELSPAGETENPSPS